MSRHIDIIRAKLGAGEALTPISALNDFGCLHLAALIYILREEGMNIKCRVPLGENGLPIPRAARYSQVKPEREVTSG